MPKATNIHSTPASRAAADARLIELCGELGAIERQIEALTERDPHAPDEGPLKGEYDRLAARRAPLIDRLDNWPELPESNAALDALLYSAGELLALGLLRRFAMQSRSRSVTAEPARHESLGATRMDIAG